MIDALRQWAFALVLTAMAGSIATAISNSPNIKKYIKFTCALIALAVMISPIMGLFRGLPDVFNYGADRRAEETMYNYNTELGFELRRLIADKSAEILARRISAAVEQKSGIKPENIYIYININDNTEADIHDSQTEVEIIIEKIIITMPESTDTGTDINMEGILAYLKEILDCEIIIE